MITSCKDCVFAEYNSDTQEGCAFNNRLAIYKSRNKAQMVSEDGVNFYKIADMCNACTKPNPKGMPPLDIVKSTVEDRLFIDNTFVLPIKEWNDDHIKHFIDSGLSQAGNPQLIIVFAKSVPDSKVHSIPQPIKTVKLLDNSLTDSILNFSIKQSKTTYLTLVEPGKILPSDLNEQINHIKNIELNHFYMIYAEKTYHGMVILNNLAKYKTLNEILELRPHALKWTNWNHESV